jgi:uncharacterized protein YjiS (DUF1127 family)
MAYAVAPKPVPFGAIATFQLVEKLNKTFESVREFYEDRATVRALSALSDSVLEDIGVCRAELQQEVRAFR